MKPRDPITKVVLSQYARVTDRRQTTYHDNAGHCNAVATFG